jgi:hypothetical protein
MTHTLVPFALAAVAAGWPAGGTPKEQPMPTSIVRARDGNIAIQEELDAARRKGSVEAYDLFIARHPDHPLATVAREERERVAAHRRQPGKS